MLTYQAITELPPVALAVLAGLVAAVILYRIYSARKWVEGVVSLLVPALLIGLAEAAGLGVVAWVKAHPREAIVWAFGYFGCGLVWVLVEYAAAVAWESRRWHKFADEWCRQHGHADAWPLLPTDRKGELWPAVSAAVAAENQRHPRAERLVYPRRYYRDRGVRFQILCWWVGFPLFVIDFVVFDLFLHLRKYLVRLISPLLRAVEWAFVEPPPPPSSSSAPPPAKPATGKPAPEGHQLFAIDDDPPGIDLEVDRGVTLTFDRAPHAN